MSTIPPLLRVSDDILLGLLIVFSQFTTVTNCDTVILSV